MQYVITGHKGFVGKHLLKRLKNVYCFNRGDDPNRVKDADVIFHLAADIKNESNMFDSNVRLTYDLLRLSRNATFIYVGSSSEYGRKTNPISEKDYLNPKTLYESTKACGSLLCLSFAAENKRVMVARPFSLYGPDDRPERFFPTMYRCYKENKELEVFSGSHDWIFVDDFIDGLMLLLEKGETGDVVNFGSGVSTTNLEVVKTFGKVVGPIKYRENLSYMKNYDSNCWVCNTTYAKEKYGFQCKTSLEEGIKRIVG